MPVSSATAVRTVTATVVKFNEEKGFGFAETSGLDRMNLVSVFFHLDGGRTVTGTADEPVLTTKPEKLYVSARPPRPTQLVMNVIENVQRGKKGWKAVQWGIVPKRDWVVDMINHGGLNRYISGSVNVSPDYGERNNPKRFGGTLTDVVLTPTSLTITVTSSNDQDVITESYDLRHANTKHVPYDTTIIMPCDNQERRVRISFQHVRRTDEERD